MAEVKGQAASVGLAHDAPLPQLVQCACQGILAEVACLGEDVGRERPSNDCSNPDDFAGARRKLCQPVRDDGVNLGRQLRRHAALCVPDRHGVGAGPHHFDGKQRVTLALFEQPGCLRVGQRPVQDLGRYLCRFRGVECPQ
ncbi:hypothetical protein D3C72_1347510 [compost metagenome]